MKSAEIIPGAIAAVAADNAPKGYGSGNIEDVRDGIAAAPVRIVAIGKFRWQRQGACERIIVEDGHTTTVKVQYVDVVATMGEEAYERACNASSQYATVRRGYRNKRRGYRNKQRATTKDQWPGMPNGVSLHGKKIVWGPEAVLETRALVLPWDHFITRRDEFLLARAETDAYQRRMHEVKTALSGLLGPWAITKATNPKLTGFGHIDADNYSRLRLTQVTDFKMTFEASVSVDWSAVPAKVRKEAEPMIKEIAFLQDKLECSLNERW